MLIFSVNIFHVKLAAGEIVLVEYNSTTRRDWNVQVQYLKQCAPTAKSRNKRRYTYNKLITQNKQRSWDLVFTKPPPFANLACFVLSILVIYPITLPTTAFILVFLGRASSKFLLIFSCHLTCFEVRTQTNKIETIFYSWT